MIKREELVISRKPYAVDLARIEGREWTEGRNLWVHIPAVWFRRKREGYSGPMRTVACLGEIRELSGVAAWGAPSAEYLATVGCMYQRVEGDCLARWDGTNLWSLADESDRAGYLDVLRPMLENFPAVPPSYDGWWSWR